MYRESRIPATRCLSILGCSLGAERFYEYFQQFGLMEKTGVDLPGEAGTIMHKKDRYRTGGTGDHVFWPVVSDHADPDGGDGQLPDQRRNQSDPAFWR